MRSTRYLVGAVALLAVASTAPIEGGIADYLRNYLVRVRSGEMGSMPAVAGLIVYPLVRGFQTSIESSGQFGLHPTVTPRQEKNQRSDPRTREQADKRIK